MKKHRGKPIVQITDPQIDDYAENHTSSESQDLLDLIQSSDEELQYIDMLSGRVVGQLLKLLVAISGARRILEIGTFTGYSALSMAEALNGEGEVVTIEMNLKYQKIAQRHFDSSKAGHLIHLIKGNAQKVMEDLEGVFDLVYLDGDKLRYQYYYDQVLPHLRSGGLIIADNVLWDGTVLKPEDPKAEAIHAFNEYVLNDDRVEQVLLPIRDGVNVIRVR